MRGAGRARASSALGLSLANRPFCAGRHIATVLAVTSRRPTMAHPSCNKNRPAGGPSRVPSFFSPRTRHRSTARRGRAVAPGRGAGHGAGQADRASQGCARAQACGSMGRQRLGPRRGGKPLQRRAFWTTAAHCSSASSACRMPIASSLGPTNGSSAPGRRFLSS